MKINRTHKIRLKPNNKQVNYFVRACGVARFTYNWGLSEWKRQYEAGEIPTTNCLKKQFNSIKRNEFPFVMEVTKCAPEQAFINLGKAFINFFRNLKQGKKPGYPKYKKKGIHDSFYIANDQIDINGKKMRIPKLGWVKMFEFWRFPNDKLLSITVNRIADKWFISINSEAEIEKPKRHNHTIGVDVGIKHLAVTSDGKFFENPKALKKAQSKIRLLQKSVSRKKKGSNNREKAKMKLAKQYYQVSNVRNDSLHKASVTITKCAGLIGVEDLNVKGMLKNHHLSKALSDASISELLRQIEYKAKWCGATVVKADRFYPSSKTCSHCGNVKKVLKLSERTYHCDECGFEMDRDLNAAINLKNYAVGSTVKAYRLGSSGSNVSSSETTDRVGISQNSVNQSL